MTYIEVTLSLIMISLNKFIKLIHCKKFVLVSVLKPKNIQRISI
jgi:hypothetical protein